MVVMAVMLMKAMMAVVLKMMMVSGGGYDYDDNRSIQMSNISFHVTLHFPAILARLLSPSISLKVMAGIKQQTNKQFYNGQKTLQHWP